MVPAFWLVLAAVAYRTLTAYFAILRNFAPFMAIPFCAGIYFSRRSAWAISLAALVLSDILINARLGIPLFNWFSVVNYATYFIGALIGYAVRHNLNWRTVIGGSLLCSVLFYLITNSFAWWGAPEYPQTFAGWWQALTVGEPGYPPTWTFFRSTVISDSLFSSAIVAAMEWQRRRVPATACAS